MISIFPGLSTEFSILYTPMEGFLMSCGRKVRYTAGQRGDSPSRATVSIPVSSISSLNFSEKVLQARNCLGLGGAFPLTISFLEPQQLKGLQNDDPSYEACSGSRSVYIKNYLNSSNFSPSRYLIS